MHFHFPILAISLISGSIASLLLLIIRKFIHIHHLKGHHEVGFPIFLQMGVIYAVLLGFVFSMVWDEFSNALKYVENEADNVKILMQLAPGLSPITETIQNDLKFYINRVVNYEWKEMMHQREDLESKKILDALQKTYINFYPQNAQQSVIYAESLHHFTTLSEYRNLRISKATEPHFSQVYGLLGIIGIIIIGVSYLFGMENITVQVTLTGLLCAMITAILTLMVLLNNPFSEHFPNIQHFAFQKILQ